MIHNPYYRIYRPFSEIALEKNFGQLLYAENDRYCDERVQLIRMYKMLQSQVIDTFQYVEPVRDNENTYSLRYHQLYGNICAEIETNFRGILKANGYTRGNEDRWNMSEDFFKTNSALKLNEYILASYCYDISSFTGVNQPFATWNSVSYSPCPWYQEHNAVKHYRSIDFKNANLKNVLTALTGLYILLYAQFGFLVDSITNKNVMHVHGEGLELTPFGVNNDMGYSFIQKPMWSDQEKYGFEWKLIEMSNPYNIFHF